jgi:hypothetical protein
MRLSSFIQNINLSPGVPPSLWNVDNLLKTVDKRHILGKSRAFVRIILSPIIPYMGVDAALSPYREYSDCYSPALPFYSTLSTYAVWKENLWSLSFPPTKYP